MVDVPQVTQPNALANLQSLATIGQNFGRDQYYNALAKKDADTQAQAEQLRGLDPSTFQTPEGYAKLFAASPEYAQRVQQHFDIQSDKEQKNLLRAAPITAGVLSLVNDQDTYDRAMTELKRQGVDTSDFPKQYDPKAVGFALAGTRHLSEGFAPTAEGGITNAPGYVAAKGAQQFAISKAAAAGQNAGVGPGTGQETGWQVMTVPQSTGPDGQMIPERKIRYNVNAGTATDLGGHPIDAAELNNIAKLTSKPAGDLPDPSDPKVQAQVQALIDGRMQFPTSFAASKPYWQEMYKLVAEQDPNFDAINYQARAKTRADFTSGKSAQNKTSLNTAIGHLGALSDAADALGNTSYPAINTVANFFSGQKGDAQINNFNITRNAVADELTRAFRGTGGSETEVQAWKQTLNAAQSPTQMHDAIKQGVDLLKSRLDALGDTYQRGMGKSIDPMELLSPKAQSTLKKLGGGAPEAAPAAAGPATASPAAAGNPYASLSDDEVLKRLGIR